MPGIIGSALGLVGPVSVYCDWVRWKVWSATSISVWQHVKLSEQICSWDTLACCWDVKQPTNKTNNPEKSLWHKQKLNSGSSTPEADALITRPMRRSNYILKTPKLKLQVRIMPTFQHGGMYYDLKGTMLTPRLFITPSSSDSVLLCWPAFYFLTERYVTIIRLVVYVVYKKLYMCGVLPSYRLEYVSLMESATLMDL